MDSLFELIKKADGGDPEAQWRVAWYIVWDDQKQPIEADWLVRAVYYFKRAADQGYGDAMLDLGAMYNVGRGVARDTDEALRWYQKAAEILHPKAFRCLGYALGFHNFRDGGFADYKSAFGYFFKGAMLDEQNSIYELGDMYLYGRYVEAVAKFAFNLYEESYEIIGGDVHDDSYADVCLRIGECCLYGRGAEQDIEAAREHLENAVRGYKIRIENGDPVEFYLSGLNKARRLLNMLDSGRINWKTLEPFQENDSEYDEFLHSDMLQYPEPSFPIMQLDELKAENPEILDFDEEPELFTHVLTAAEMGDSTAMYHMAFYCFNRYENEPNNEGILTFALYYYHKAIRCGFKGAMYNLGAIYYHGNGGVEIDKSKAFQLYRHCGVLAAQGEIGVYYAKGETVPQDYEKAFLCFAKFALSKMNLCYGSLANLAQMYRKGIFVDIDVKFADYCESLSKKAEKNLHNPEGSL